MGQLFDHPHLTAFPALQRGIFDQVVIASAPWCGLAPPLRANGTAEGRSSKGDNVGYFIPCNRRQAGDHRNIAGIPGCASGLPVAR